MPYNYKEWSLEKVLLEMRFSSSPAYFDKKINFLKRYIIDFPDYEDKTDGLIMRTNSFPPQQLTVQPGRVGIVFEEPKNLDEFIAWAVEFANYTAKALDIKTITHLGMRADWVRPMDIQDAASEVQKKIETKLFTNIGRCENAEISFRCRNEDIVSQVKASPGKIGRFKVQINGSSEPRIVEGLLVDIDIFTNNETPKIETFIRCVPDLYYQLLSRFEA